MIPTIGIPAIPLIPALILLTSSAGSHNPILVPWVTIVSRIELVTTVVVDHRSTNPINDQARCFPYAPLRDMERSSTASASEGKVERFDLNFQTHQQVRAIAHSAPALQSDDSVHVFDSTNLALASDHQAKAFDSTTLVVVAEDHYQLNMPQHCLLDHLHH